MPKDERERKTPSHQFGYFSKINQKGRIIKFKHKQDLEKFRSHQIIENSIYTKFPTFIPASLFSYRNFVTTMRIYYPISSFIKTRCTLTVEALAETFSPI